MRLNSRHILLFACFCGRQTIQPARQQTRTADARVYFIAKTKMMKQPWRTASLAAAAVLLASCVQMSTADLAADIRPSSVPVTVDSVAGDNDLVRLARGQNQGILNTYGGAYSDTKLELSVARIVGKLVAVSPNPQQTYNITILNSPQINAFALPGGYLYITRGLLALANDSSELAAVIAHEMAHVLANHGIQRARLEAREALAGRVISEVWRDKADIAQSKLRGKLRLAQFSREQELEADVIGIDLIAKAGFDPYAAVRFQRSMAAYSAFRRNLGETDGSLDFLASHPSAPQRQTLAEQKARQIGPVGTGSRERDAYLAGLDGLLYGDSADEGYVRGTKFSHPGLGIAFDVPPGFSIDNTAAAVLATGPGDAAIRFDGAKLSPAISMTDYLASGWVGGLDAASIRPLTLNGLEAANGQATAKNWRFDITVIRVGDGVYRILTAVPGTNDPEPVAAIVRNSFRGLSAAERAAIKPLRLKIVTAKAGETPATFAARMNMLDRPQELFRLLNGLGAAGTVSAGDKIKLVTDE
jgi:predicted Zn-dependent protease